jgi:hypothetical protein
MRKTLKIIPKIIPVVHFTLLIVIAFKLQFEQTLLPFNTLKIKVKQNNIINP